MSKNSNAGFSLVELIVVLAILSIMSVTIAPKISVILSSKRKNTALLRNYIAKTFDSAFVESKNNYLVLKLSDVEVKEDEFSKMKKNSMAVYNIDGSKFIPSTQRHLKTVVFNNSFLIDSVLFKNQEPVSTGVIIIPFYKEGYSQNVIIYIKLDEDEYMTFFISKFEKEPYIFKGKLSFEELWDETMQ